MNEVIVKRTYARPPEEIFGAFLKEELLKKWFTPSEDINVEILELQPEEGGEFRIRYSETQSVTGTYLVIEPPKKLVFTWSWLPPDIHAGVDSMVSVEFEGVDHDQSTALTLTHSRLSNEMMVTHPDGWNQILDNLTHQISQKTILEPAWNN